MTIEELKNYLYAPGVKKMILDTDTYNEMDDQYALAYCMLSPDKVQLLSVNAAPFFNSRSSSPEDGMEKSYQEILRIMKMVDPDAAIPAYRGSRTYLPDKKTPVESEACDNIINTVMNTPEPVVIVAIGAITNVASAILKCPEIVEKTALVWLGGQAIRRGHAAEFNLSQDIAASQIIFDSGIPLVQVPCAGVVTEFYTTIPELEYWLRGKNELCDYLTDIVKAIPGSDRPGFAKVLWDVVAAAVLIQPGAVRMDVLPTPVLTNDGYYSFVIDRKPYLYMHSLNRSAIFGDLFTKLANK